MKTIKYWRNRRLRCTNKHRAMRRRYALKFYKRMSRLVALSVEMMDDFCLEKLTDPTHYVAFRLYRCKHPEFEYGLAPAQTGEWLYVCIGERSRSFVKRFNDNKNETI